MQFDLSGQPPGWHIANRSEILIKNIRLQIDEVPNPVWPAALDSRANNFAEERTASDIGQQEDGGDREDASRRESQVSGDHEQKETEVFVVASGAFDGDVGRQNSADKKESVDGEKSIQKAAQRKIVEYPKDVEGVRWKKRKANFSFCCFIMLIHR